MRPTGTCAPLPHSGPAASVLITNEAGDVLVQEVDYRSTRLLPGGGVDPGESPTAAASRELMEELGVEEAVDQALAVDWVAPDAAPTPAAMRFPGELLTVFDGGTWEDGRIAEIRLPPSEITAISFVTPARLPDLLSPTDARRALSALRARINGAGTALLENGRPIAPTVLDRLRVLSTAPPAYHYSWHPGEAPPGHDIAQVWAWAFAPDGRILVLLDPETSTAVLPGGKPESRDQGDPASTLRRESDEEAAAQLGTPLLIGHVADPSRPRVCLRYAAALTGMGPARPDPATGTTYTRILATPEQAVSLFDWGPHTSRRTRRRPPGPPTPRDPPRRPPGRHRTHRNHLMVNTAAHPNRRTSPETT